ncbi:DUF4157 domain-containing protein [Nostoc sp. LEGE 12450]|uniref:eCIS core domain-containing protein n=1 Tax=Nostoc sp. LEGE 12450 TaxID=1828643 RepID=UPI001D13CFDE|nr:DUF4157 domain-containing protein [Nostoc sp. LEGE 12450]
MHKTKSSKTDSSTYSNSSALNSSPQLAHRPYGSEIQKASVAAKTPTDIENEGFAEQQMEATGLSIQAKSGSITSEGQERLTVLQAKMNGLLNSRLEHATRFGHNIAKIPLRRPDTPIQAKLTIGEPGDKYEQEADETARQVVQRIHEPQSKKLQRESLPEKEDELQMKPEHDIQREALPEEEEEVQMKPEGSVQREPLPEEEAELQMKPMVQRRVYVGGVSALPDLETGIQQAQVSGQPLAKSIREPMEQAFGADFSRVKVHIDTQANQLNQSIQAKAFTTGQDVFFRQGAYEPESRGGQELLAHELTHVVQQSRGDEITASTTKKEKEIVSQSSNSCVLQRKLGDGQYAPPATGGIAMKEKFVLDHVPDNFSKESAVEIAGNRGYPIITIIAITDEEAKEEIKNALEKEAKTDITQLFQYEFDTNNRYPTIEVKMNQDTGEYTFDASISCIKLKAQWQESLGYFQIYHFGGKV